MTKHIQKSNEILEIRDSGFIPVDLGLKPERPNNLTLGTHFEPALSLIFGTRQGVANTANVTNVNELVTAVHGTAFETYTVKKGTAPATFNQTEVIQGDIPFQRFDITVTAQTVSIRFTLADGTDGADIFLPVGFTSIPMQSKQIQIKNNGTAGTFEIVAYR